MGFVDGGTGSSIYTCAPYNVVGTEEYNINLEDVLDIINEMPETKSFPPINTENEVRIRGEFEVVAAHAF
jgi:hypothetical protein